MLPCGTLLKTIIFDSSFIPKNSVQYTTKLLIRNQESSPCQFDRTHVSALLRSAQKLSLFCPVSLPTWSLDSLRHFAISMSKPCVPAWFHLLMKNLQLDTLLIAQEVFFACVNHPSTLWIRGFFSLSLLIDHEIKWLY